MSTGNAFLRFPARIEVPEALGGGVYVLRTDCYALRGGWHASESERVLFELEEGATAVLRGLPAPGEEARAVPVYELPGGALGVPTGRLFARFREGTDARAQSRVLKGVGYEIVEIPGWEPHAAWIARRVGCFCSFSEWSWKRLRASGIIAAPPFDCSNEEARY